MSRYHSGTRLYLTGPWCIGYTLAFNRNGALVIEIVREAGSSPAGSIRLQLKILLGVFSFP